MGRRMRGGGPLDVTGRRCRGRKWAGERLKIAPALGSSSSRSGGGSESAGATLLLAPPRRRRRRRLGTGSGAGTQRPENAGLRGLPGEVAVSRWGCGEGRPGSRAGGGGGARRNRLRWAPARSAGTGRAGRVALTMVSCWDTGVLLCALLGGLLVTGEARPGAAPRGEGNRAPRGSGHYLRFSRLGP